MLKKDFLKNKSITVVLFIFIMLSAFLAALGTHLIVELTNSINKLFTMAEAPHFVQMHTGEINENELNTFAANNQFVKDNQIVEMVQVDGHHIDLGDGTERNNNGVMDHYFVKQNDSFDLLLNLNNEVIHVSEGEIAVPIYYMQEADIKLGDVIRILTDQLTLELLVVDFVRDVQMNPSIIHSKRFLVNEKNLNELKNSGGSIEYLIEFKLTDLKKLTEFRQMYQSAHLPEKGPQIDYNLFKMLHGVTDGIVATIIILISMLIVIIALYCMRYTIIAALEEDYREIGVLKAIGIGNRHIKTLFLLKYFVLAALACTAGYVLALLFSQKFTAHLMLYIGKAPKSVFLNTVPLLAVCSIFLFVVICCHLTFKKFNKMTAVEALRTGYMGDIKLRNQQFTLSKNKLLNLHLFLGIRDVFLRFKLYRLLLIVFILCSFMMIVPINFLNTIQAPTFIKYLGVEQSDIRIDIQQSDTIHEEFEKLINYIENDEEIKKYSTLMTSQIKVINDEGLEEKITVETGDFSFFSLDYVKGRAPLHDNEIALSHLNAKEYKKNVGDSIKIITNETEHVMFVSGIYQDVTNGGRTAKAKLPINIKDVLTYKIILDINPHIRVNEKVNAYANMFNFAKVIDIEGYVNQTFGKTIEQIANFTIFTVLIALFISMLITALCLKMIIAKDDTEIAIMKAIGFSINDIRIQYVTRSLFTLLIGIIIGTVLSNTVGQRMVSVLMSFMGASDIEFVINSFQAYFLCPFLLTITVILTTIFQVKSINQSCINGMKME